MSKSRLLTKMFQMVEVRKFGTADDLKAFKKAKSDLTAKISLDFTAKK